VKLAFDHGGDGGDLLVLLHGLGATRCVWTNFIAARRWTGSWIAPDLRGHGASAHAADYSLNAHAADVAELTAAHGAANSVTVLGHSMGGAIGLALASGEFGFLPARMFGLGIKVAWSADELAGLRSMAQATPRIFATKDEAIARYLKVSGLTGLAPNVSEIALSGIAEVEGGWRLACDPRTASVGQPPMESLMAAARAPVHLACGEGDTLTNVAQLARYDAAAQSLSGGHNIMMENPAAVWDWLQSKSETKLT